MKRFLLFEKYILTTKLSSEQVYRSIADNIDRLDHFRIEFLSYNTKLYEGRVSANSFEVRKIGSSRTSLLVFAKGTINELDSDTQIKISIRPSLSALLFHTFWFGLVTVVGILAFWVGLTKDLRGFLFLLGPVILLFWGSHSISFSRESEDLKNFLATILKEQSN